MPSHYCDQREIPSFGLIGEKHRPLTPDDTLISEYEDWQRDACQHPDYACKVIKGFDKAGRLFFRKVCVDCGVSSSGIKRMEASKLIDDGRESELTVSDIKERSEEYIKWRMDRYKEISSRCAERNLSEFHSDYDEYLGSEFWLDIRDRVMDRASYICEGCRNEPAKEVHHLS